MTEAMAGPYRRPALTRRPPTIPNGVLGMLVFILTEIMLFAGLISAHVIAKSGAAVWPPPGQPLLPVWQTGFNTLLLLASGVTIWQAGRAFDRKLPRALPMLLLSTMLGVFFVVFQGVEWVSLIREGLTIKSSSQGAFFYLLVGTHGLHAVIAILAMAAMALRAKRGTLDSVSFASARVFWYFVVGVWPILYWQVYG